MLCDLMKIMWQCKKRRRRLKGFGFCTLLFSNDILAVKGLKRWEFKGDLKDVSVFDDLTLQREVVQISHKWTSAAQMAITSHQQILLTMHTKHKAFISLRLCCTSALWVYRILNIVCSHPPWSWKQIEGSQIIWVTQNKQLVILVLAPALQCNFLIRATTSLPCRPTRQGVIE